MNETQIAPKMGLLEDDRIYPKPNTYQLTLQGVCLLYPLYYEILQMRK